MTIAPACPVYALLLAGGVGIRSGLDRPKQLETLGGKPVLRWSIDALTALPGFARLTLVVPEEWRNDHAVIAGSDADLCVGGATRRQSVANALVEIAEVPADAIVLVHDAARPGVSADVLARLIDAVAAGAAAAIPVLPVADTLVARAGPRAAGAPVDRDALWRVQTPQAFRLDVLRAAHAQWTGAEPTDDAQMVRALGHDITAVAGSEALHKLTFRDDIALLESLMGIEMTGSTRIAVGMGYDVHRLVTGKPLWLGGLNIPHSHGLSGHSDADVALHALTDAILGALAEGDIGSHFPPSDAKWKGAASDAFLAFARDRVAARGGAIEHVDLTIICEAPKIGPHRDAMRARIAGILAIKIEHVSVKATTTEGLGFTGRGEGIAAQAVATLKLKD